LDHRSVCVGAIHLVAVLARLAGPGGVRGLVAENLLMKEQLLVLSRSRQRAPNLSSRERFVLGLCTLFVSPRRMPRVAAGVRAPTLHKLHQYLVRRKYRALFSARPSRRRPGPKGPSEELVRTIVEIKRRNPSFGCPRIAPIISTTFGVEVDKDVVRRVLEKHLRPGPGGGGPSWLTVIGHAKDSLWSVDLFRCESILLKTHWVLVVMDQFTRRIIGFAVHVGDVDGLSLCHMFNRVISRHALARYLSTDHDPLFRYHRWQTNLRVLDIEPVKTVPYVPVSHPFVERLIGSVRRELSPREQPRQLLSDKLASPRRERVAGASDPAKCLPAQLPITMTAASALGCAVGRELGAVSQSAHGRPTALTSSAPRVPIARTVRAVAGVDFRLRHPLAYRSLC
jgi:transposase InsO family protein